MLTVLDEEPTSLLTAFEESVLSTETFEEVEPAESININEPEEALSEPDKKTVADTATAAAVSTAPPKISSFLLFTPSSLPFYRQ